jgi:hypothetical protein
MKKIILCFLILIVTLSFTYPQTAREVEVVKEKITKKLPFALNKEFKVSASVFNESFEGAEFPPSDWLQYSYGGSGWSRESAGTPLPGWITDKVITTPPNGGNFVAYCSWNGDNTYNDQWLITPLIQNIQPNDRIYFWLRKQLGYPDTVYIYYSLDGTNFNQMGHVSYPLNSDTNWGLWYSRIGDVMSAGSNAYVGFREYVEDNTDNGATISLDLIYTVSYPVNITINKSFTFGDPAQQASYKMIGVPGNINIPIGPLMNGEQKKDWNVFYDDGSEPANLREFDGQATFNFRPGKGFWALSRNPINVPSQQVSSVTVGINNTFQLNLNPGWNIISNPFERSVNWAEVQNINGITQPIHLFEGTYTQPNLMETYKGYYFFNADNLGNILIPYDQQGTLGKNKITEGGGINTGDLEISLMVENKKRSAAFVSINPESKNEYDKYDIFAPPSNFEEVKVSIFNKLLPSYKYLMIDSRNEIGEGQIYDLQVKNLSGKPSSIQIKGTENFGLKEVYLLDLRLKKSYNLKLQKKIDLNSLHMSYEFKLVIGSKDFVEQINFSHTPEEFKLYQNYPNPFNPSTIIMFDLPLNQNINLFIYNILGERIKSLFSGNLEAGRYEFGWNGTNDSGINLPSGVYIYSMEGTDIKFSKKMILNR